ncbi:MAG: hypothetical protein ACREUU_07550 [Gammaproteobacteria bacterium]
MLDERALVEVALTEFVEINCSVLGPPERASACEQPRTSEALLTFEAKYKSAGKKTAGGGSKAGLASLGRIMPAPISPELTSRIQGLAMRAFQAIGARGVARADFLLNRSQNGLYLNEINTMPGSLAFYLWEASGLPFDELVGTLVESALERQRIRKQTTFSFASNLLRAEP